MQEAKYYQKLEDNRIECQLCPQKCIIAEGKVGFCRVRINLKGTLYTKIYQQISSCALDPIEKKPLYHFYPGSEILSLGTLGCNFKCPFCQNWEISQSEVPTRSSTSLEIIEYARRCNSIGIAYTYNEPFIWYEYVYETAQLAHQHKLVNVLVTNGFVNEEPLREILPLIDAMNIDLKSISNDFYRNYCRGELEPVLRTIKISSGFCHVELTNLIIPTLNDSLDNIQKLVDWVADLNPEMPLHFSRYFPHYKMTIPPTPVETLVQAWVLARKKLKFVYLGNILDPKTSTTYCPVCNKPLISRQGYSIDFNYVEGGKCKYCGEKIAGVF